MKHVFIFRYFANDVSRVLTGPDTKNIVIGEPKTGRVCTIVT